MDFAAPPTLTARQLDIVDAATRVFSNHGYRAGTVQLVAAEAGLSQAGLLHHFPSKDAILLAVIEQRERQDLEVLLPAFERGDSVIDAFRQVLARNAGRPEMMRLFAVLSAEALNSDHPAHEFFHRRYDFFFDATRDAVRKNQDDGVIRDDLPADEIARLIIAAGDGLRYQVLIGNDPGQHWEHLASLERLLAVPQD